MTARDWDKELAKIDKLMGQDGGSGPRPAATGDEKRPQATTGDTRRQDATAGDGTAIFRRQSSPAVAASPLAAWGIAILGALGAAGLSVWPYAHGCGIWLIVYLVGVLAVFGSAIWTMRRAWTSRRGVVMVLGVLILIASLTLAAREVLPRVGYASTTLTWNCTT
ncbi:MAG TPA: hypothetical protein PLL69_03955 [Gemmatimonadales bacterium]|nr:hypothetical protein [Gemmatimonadales bacterium]